MTTILKATTERFTEMFELLSMSKGNEPLFNPISVTIVEDDGKEPYLQMLATNQTNTAATSQKHRKISIHQNEDSDSRIVMDATEILKALTMFESDKEIEIEFDTDNITISDTEAVEISDTITLPALDPGYVPAGDIAFEINDKGLPTKGDKPMNFDITATIPTDFIRAQIKRADFVNVSPRLFQMDFDGNKLKLIVGDDSDSYVKSVKSTVAISGKGSGMCVYGDGYEQIFGSLPDEILFMANSGKPCWITSKTDNHICQFMLAPAFTDPADLPE
jgi:hypothetical protein